MRFYLKVQSDKQKQVLEKIRRLRKPKIVAMTPNEDDTIIIRTKPFASDHTDEIKKFTNKLEKFPSIDSVSPGPIFREKNELENNIFSRTCHFFFDIDSTLTRYTGTINKKVKPLLKTMGENNNYLYLASGRSHTQIMEDMKKLEYVEDYAIAENGGIILRGYAPDTECRFGSKGEPLRVLDTLKKNYNDGIRIDKEQGIRLTEIILLQTSVLTKQDIENTIKEIGADAQVLSSKNSFHISKKGVDKGSALEKLTSYLDLGNDLTIAVGDSELDVPMFKATDYGFAPNNASEEICSMNEKRPIIMSKTYFEGVIEMYEKYFIKKAS